MNKKLAIVNIVNAAPIIQDWQSSGCLAPDERGVPSVPTLKCVEVIFGNILVMASALIVLVLFIMFIIGSLNYLTSGGNPEKLKKAQATLTYAIIGTLLFLGSFIILKIIDVLFLGGTGKLFELKIGE